MSTLRSMSIPRPVHSKVPRNVTSRAAKSGVKRRVNTGAMFSITLCLASTSQEATRTAPAAPHGSSHDCEEGLGVDPDGPEDHRHERREDTAAEGDQHVVDEELAREADEVHAARHLAPAAAGVGDAHHQPERDRQVQRRQRLGVAARDEGIDVGEDTRRDERRGQPAQRAGVEPPFPDEVAGQEGQHEETQVAGVEAGVLIVQRRSRRAPAP